MYRSKPRRAAGATLEPCPVKSDPGGVSASPAALIAAGVVLVVLLLGARTIASYAIEVAWWKELGQFHTWLSMLTYSVAPVAGATVVAFFALWIAHARALKFAGTRLGEHPLYARLSTLAALALGYFIAASSIDTWTVIRFAGSRGLASPAGAWHDAVFARPLSFYLFDLPFYDLLRGYVLALVILSILVYWAAARGWQLRHRFPDMVNAREMDASFFQLEGGLESRFLRGAGVALLLAMVVKFYLGRYEMVYNQHGSFMVGIDWVDLNVGLPMQWLLILAALAAAVLVWMGRWMKAAFMAIALVLAFAVPRIVSAVYVAPNEISLERPYIQTHIHATRSAYDLDTNVHEIEFHADPGAPLDIAHNQATLDNVRLWDCARVSRHRHPDPGAAPLLRFQGYRRRPLHHRRPLPPGAGVAARARRQPVTQRTPELDQPRDHLHPRLRPGDGPRQPDHAQRHAGAADSGCAAAHRHSQPEADAAGTVLWRSHSRTGVRQHRAGGVQLPVRRRQRAQPL